MTGETSTRVVRGVQCHQLIRMQDRAPHVGREVERVLDRDEGVVYRDDASSRQFTFEHELVGEHVDERERLERRNLDGMSALRNLIVASSAEGRELDVPAPHPE